MKKRIGILILCICLVLAGCTSNMSNTPDLTRSVEDAFNPEKELNVLYSISPYSQLLPRKILDGYMLYGYRVENHSDVSMLHYSTAYSLDYSAVSVSRTAIVSFCNEADTSFFVSIGRFVEETIPPTPIIDPSDPETDYKGVFRAEDLTAALIAAKMGKFDQKENVVFEVGVLCGDWQVSYRGSYYGQNLQDWPVSAQQLYDMITSSLYYTEENVELESSPDTLANPSLAELEITQEERDALYSIAPYDQLLPRKILDEYVPIEVAIVPSDNIVGGAPLVLQNEEGIQIEITVGKYNQDKDVVADPNDPKTYDALWYSQQSEKPKETYSNGLFHAKDITPGLIEARMGTFTPGERFNFRVSVLCGDYVVTYRWYPTNKEYPEELPISALQMLRMITSSRYFTE